MTEINKNKHEDPNEYYNEKDVRLNEWKLAKYCLIFSICVIIAKVYNNNSSQIHNFLLKDELVRKEHFTEGGELMFRHMWVTSLRYSSIWLPILCGMFGTYFTWVIVYLDSKLPGIHPPSPLSPSKYKIQSGHSIHLNYAFSFLVGVLVATCMYAKGVALQY